MKKEDGLSGEFLKLKEILKIIPVSRSAWYAGAKDGRFPSPIKIGPKTAVWHISDIENVIKNLVKYRSCKTPKSKNEKATVPVIKTKKKDKS